jgi:phosphoribosylformimino-5-aminoimidazole carboxamide ribotide isomerase
LSGPPLGLYKEILGKFPDLKLLASGGVRNMDDVQALKEIGVFATIFGKAYFEGHISIEEIEAYNKQS